MEGKLLKSIEDLKVGMKVWIRDDLVDGATYGIDSWEDVNMKSGEIVINEFCTDGFHIPEDSMNYTYTPEMIDWDKTNLANGLKADEVYKEEFAIAYDSEFVGGIDKIIFAKINEDSEAKIPSKEDEDAGYDIYALFDEDYIEIQPHQTILIPTGIASAFDKKYRFELWERGSTGTKGIGQRCGVIDSGFRGEWKVPVTNHNNDKTIVILKDKNDIGFVWDESKVIVYPYSKAICQALLDEVPEVDKEVMTYEELLKIESKRGVGMLGSSGK